MRKKISALFLSFFLLPIVNSGCARRYESMEIRPWNAWMDRCEIIETSPNLNNTLSLERAIEIGLCYNLDMRMQNLELWIEREKKMASAFRMLPSLGVTGELSQRSNNPAYSSLDLETGVIGSPGQSALLTTRRWDLTGAINYLDFGLAYFQACQAEDRVFMLQQRQLRARQNLILDITRAYYRASVAQEAIEQSKNLIARFEEQQFILDGEIESRSLPKLRALLNQSDIIGFKSRLSSFENEHRTALIELRALLGVAPHVCLNLEDKPYCGAQDLNKSVNVCELEETALLYRPELWAQDFQGRIDADQVRASIVNMMPGLPLFGGRMQDNNTFLLYQNWLSFGFRATWDLLSLPSKYYTLRANRFNEVLSKKARLSMSMGILSQVNLAYVNVIETKERLALALQLKDVKDKIFITASEMELAGTMSQDRVLNFEVEMLFSKVAYAQACANYRVALSQLENTVGRPALFSNNEPIKSFKRLENGYQGCRINR